MRYIAIHQTASLILKWRLLGLLIFLGINSLYAQTEDGIPLDSLLMPLVTETSTNTWMDFNERTNTNGNELFIQHRDAFRLRDEDEMRLIQQNDDDLGYMHFRFQQFYKNLRIEDAIFLVHDLDGRSVSANGVYVWGNEMEADPLLNSLQATRLALAHINAEVYMWEDSALEVQIQELQNDPNATYYPQAELIFAAMEDERRYAADAYRLAYQVDVHALRPLKSVAVYIDALDGTILKEIALSHTCDQAAGKTTWHGNQIFYTDKKSNSSTYYLKDDCQYTTILTRYRDVNNKVHHYYDGDNQWFANGDQAGVTTHWSIKMAYNYFLNVHNRIGWNGKGANIYAYNEIGSDAGYWLNGTMVLGLNSANTHNDDVNTLDIVGHEFTHGVLKTTAGLVYQGESGALNESFADIFGTMVEWEVEGYAYFDWKIGEDNLFGPIRNLKDPKIMGHPDTYKGSFWQSTNNCAPKESNDYCGVHTNSGVQNYWFYLLSEGGSGVNDKGDSYQVSGIGVVKARQIAYRSLRCYLCPKSTYIDARKASIKAAKDLYGTCSFEAQQVSKAWYAVGVGKTPKLHKEVCGNLSGSSIFGGTLAHQAVYTLTAGGNNCITNILPSPYYITFIAGQHITLKPGFRTQPNAKFLAYTSGCALTSARKASGENNVERGIHRENKVNIELFSPKQLSLKAYPNPFSTQTVLEYELPTDGNTSLIIRDLLGKIVAQPLSSTPQRAGNHYITFNASDLSAGVYLAIVQHKGKQFVRKLMVRK